MRPFITLGFILLCSSPVWADWRNGGSAGPYVKGMDPGTSSEVPGDRTGLLLNLNFEKKFNSKWKFKSDLSLRTDFLARDEIERYQFIPSEFYLQARSGMFTFKAGLQTLLLDGPDIINPADVVHAKNWIDPTSPVTLPSAGVSVELESGDWSWSVLYVPRQTGPVYPGKHSPWLPRENRLPIESADTEIRIPDDVSYRYQSATELNDALSHNVSFLLQNKSENLESQFLYFNGLAHGPFLLTNVTGTLLSINPDVIAVDSPVSLRPLYYRHHALAATFNLPFESWAIRGGFNWLSPQGSNERIPRESTLSTIGFEKSFNSSWGLISLMADYVRQQRQDENQISFLRSVFEEAVVIGSRIPLGEEAQILAGGAYDLIGGSSFYTVQYNLRLSSSWSLEARGEFLQGSPKTLLGLYEKYDSYQLKLFYGW